MFLHFLGSATVMGDENEGTNKHRKPPPGKKAWTSWRGDETDSTTSFQDAEITHNQKNEVFGNQNSEWPGWRRRRKRSVCSFFMIEKGTGLDMQELASY